MSATPTRITSEPHLHQGTRSATEVFVAAGRRVCFARRWATSWCRNPKAGMMATSVRRPMRPKTRFPSCSLPVSVNQNTCAGLNSPGFGVQPTQRSAAHGPKGLAYAWRISSVLGLSLIRRRTSRHDRGPGVGYGRFRVQTREIDNLPFPASTYLGLTDSSSTRVFEYAVASESTMLHSGTCLARALLSLESSALGETLLTRTALPYGVRSCRTSRPSRGRYELRRTKLRTSAKILR